MPHARLTGTAWDRTKEDYAYTRELESTAWAWEFLRRNRGYREEFLCRDKHDFQIDRRPHGITVYKSRGRSTKAEYWGLAMLADPDKTALTQDVIWLPELTTYSTSCALRPTREKITDTLSLERLNCHAAVLLKESKEIVAVRAAGTAVTLRIVSGSVLRGRSAVSFSHEGFKTLSRHYETLHMLQQLMTGTSNENRAAQRDESKYLAYLIALDGHLEGRSYRDIAIVLYGADRVGTHWADDTRWMKSKVRRAVERGITLMNGGYRELL